ncbi:unnamed protein product [Acanthosepion pharaonis]|uniref:Uncharacterized protein n=1 Tax=Acanthosepion pharaonis TaxID=158019 RepID=A0A812B5P7_ACAPH|nr:unnamed protein product [Sepia pharaonis]
MTYLSIYLSIYLSQSLAYLSLYLVLWFLFFSLWLLTLSLISQSNYFSTCCLWLSPFLFYHIFLFLLPIFYNHIALSTILSFFSSHFCSQALCANFRPSLFLNLPFLFASHFLPPTLSYALLCSSLFLSSSSLLATFFLLLFFASHFLRLFFALHVLPLALLCSPIFPLALLCFPLFSSHFSLLLALLYSPLSSCRSSLLPTFFLSLFFAPHFLALALLCSPLSPFQSLSPHVLLPLCSFQLSSSITVIFFFLPIFVPAYNSLPPTTFLFLSLSFLLSSFHPIVTILLFPLLQSCSLPLFSIIASIFYKFHGTTLFVH